MTQDELRALFDYDAETGVLKWRHRECVPKQVNSNRAGKIAGTLRHDGYIQIAINRKFRVAHRIAWEMVHGPIAEGYEIDHVNGVRTDNRLENLRLATRSQNRRNSRARGEWPKGVYCNRYGKFVAQLKMAGVNQSLGQFNTPEAAHEMYAFTADLYFGEFACTTR